jgi:hypothetical protein
MTHHHHGGEAHPPATVAPSLLRLSLSDRLKVAGWLIVLILIATLWATR